MVRHRTRSIEFKCQIAQDYLAGETVHSLARQHDCESAWGPDADRRDKVLKSLWALGPERRAVLHLGNDRLAHAPARGPRP